MKGRSSRHPRTRQGGTILLAAMITVVVVGTLSAALYSAAVAEIKLATTNQNCATWTYLGEGAIKVATQEALQAIANFRWVIPPYDPGSPLPAWTGTATVTRVRDVNGSLRRDTVEVPYRVEPVVATGGGYVERVDVDADGVQTLYRSYMVLAPDPSADFSYRNVTRTLREIMEVGLTPLFQYAVFYDNDLEVLPGPSMQLSGRVHSNTDIYVGCDNTLRIASNYFRCAGQIFRKRKNDGSATGGRVEIEVSGSPGSYQRMLSKADLQSMGIPSESGFDSAFLGYDGNGDGDIQDPEDYPDFTVGSLMLWNGSVQTGAHGINRLHVPEIGTIKRYVPDEDGDWRYDYGEGEWEYDPGNGDHSKGFYFENADLSIVDGVAYDREGNVVPLPMGTVQQKTMYDGRENKNVTVTEVDMSRLATSPNWPENGLLYVARTDATLAEPNGVRLKNGSQLRSPLTVVSENPVYVWGDYNTVEKKGAAIITDAINLLSNGWDNSKKAGTLPKARETTYNAAMITGSYGTTTGDYNGGFENLPRFHENWTGVRANIRGSFVNIYDSDYAQGRWVYGGDNYTAPNRNWDYDTDFNNAAYLPPFTPNVPSVHGVVRLTDEFDHTVEP
ncbi:MAG: hypothetical protein AB1486_22955 [Planctomycetota bacterium]